MTSGISSTAVRRTDPTRSSVAGSTETNSPAAGDETAIEGSSRRPLAPHAQRRRSVQQHMDTTRYTILATPVGDLLLAGHGRRLTAVEMLDHAPQAPSGWVRDDRALAAA